jgi:hypothetical protein
MGSIISWGNKVEPKISSDIHTSPIYTESTLVFMHDGYKMMVLYVELCLAFLN